MSPKKKIAEAYRSWLDAVNRQDTEGIHKLLSDSIVYNGDTTFSKADYIGHMTETLPEFSIDHRIDLDMLTVNNDASALAARLIHQATLSDQRVEWPEHIFIWFNADGKISRIQTLIDLDALHSDTPSVPLPRTSHTNPSTLPPGSDLPAMYRAYIHAINTHTMTEHFPLYCHPSVTHNARALSLGEYGGFIEDSFGEIRGLSFTVREIVADDDAQYVAARLEFTGTPVSEFRGIRPNGRAVRFWEHVLYGLDGGRISWVWSLLDLEAFRRCLEG
ncbi:hypothetical protein ACO1O0_006630 [Amphichorda felina]